MKTARAHAGFTLVELMIALIIGLVLTLVVAQLFVGSRRTFATTDDVARMQENMRFANQFMSRMIRQSGYRTAPNTRADFIFLAPNLMVDGTAGGSPDTPDTLIVRFEGSGAAPGDGSVVNCRGERVPAGVMSTNTFSIVNIAKTDAGDLVQVPTLVCTTDTAPGTNQPIVSDVENMKILYGEQTTGEDVNPDRYMARGSVSDPNNVVALRIALLFRSPNANVGTSIAPTTQTFNLNGQTVTKSDSRVRRDALFTVSLRNRSP